MIENNLTKAQKRELKKQEKQQRKEQEKKKKQLKQRFFWATILILILLIIGGLIKLTKMGTYDINKPFEITQTDHIKGNKNAKVTLIEFSDFQCPACKRFMPYVKKIAEKYSNDLRVVYRHFPLTSIHKNAILAARASEAASKQGKFWAMHDLLFNNQEEWAESENPMKFFEEYAKLLSLDMEKFKQDFNSKETTRKIKTDRALAFKLQLRGTPTFFLNGQELHNLKSFEEFEQKIKEQIDKIKNKENKENKNLEKSQNKDKQQENQTKKKDDQKNKNQQQGKTSQENSNN